MAEARLDLKHVRILMASHAKYAVRGGSGITFVLLVIVLGLVVAGILIDPLDQKRKELERQTGGPVPREQFVSGIVEAMKHFSGFWLGKPPDDPQVDYLLNERPALLSVMFLILLAFVPFVMGFGGFNQLSGDIGNRGLRYLLLRTSRLNIVISRFLGTFLFAALTSLFTAAVIVMYLSVRYDIYSFGDLAKWGLYCWAMLNLFGLPYLALCTWISTAIGSPFGALALSQVAIYVPIVSIKFMAMNRAWDVDWLDRLTPWGWRTQLLHPDWSQVGLAAAVLLGFTSLFFFLGARHFLRRDL
jgi:hypothetical protein